MTSPVNNVIQQLDALNSTSEHAADLGDIAFQLALRFPDSTKEQDPERYGLALKIAGLFHSIGGDVNTSSPTQDAYLRFRMACLECDFVGELEPRNFFGSPFAVPSTAAEYGARIYAKGHVSSRLNKLESEAKVLRTIDAADNFIDAAIVAGSELGTLEVKEIIFASRISALLVREFASESSQINSETLASKLFSLTLQEELRFSRNQIIECCAFAEIVGLGLPLESATVHEWTSILEDTTNSIFDSGYAMNDDTACVNRVALLAVREFLSRRTPKNSILELWRDSVRILEKRDEASAMSLGEAPIVREEDKYPAVLRGNIKSFFQAFDVFVDAASRLFVGVSDLPPFDGAEEPLSETLRQSTGSHEKDIKREFDIGMAAIATNSVIHLVQSVMAELRLNSLYSHDNQILIADNLKDQFGYIENECRNLEKSVENLPQFKNPEPLSNAAEFKSSLNRLTEALSDIELSLPHLL